MANSTIGGGECPHPFLPLADFPYTAGYESSRLCAPLPASGGSLFCCLPCPMTDWVYPDNFNRVSTGASWLNVGSLVSTIFLLLSFLFLPVSKTRRHYLTVSLVIAVGLMSLSFIIPLGTKPDQCHDRITVNDMYSDMSCAWSGSFLLFGGFAAVTWVFLRSLSLHLQILFQITLGRKFFISALILGWGLPALFLAILLPVTGVLYRFGETCHINHEKSVQTYWGPLMGIAGAAAVLQFITFAYCIKVYIRAMLNDDPTTETGSGLPSYSGSVRTGGTVITARAAYRRVSQVIALHWRAIVIIMIILVDVFFLAAVFIKSDNAESKDLSDITVAGPWLFCLVVSGGDKDACLPEVSSLVVSEAIVMSVLYLLSFNGYWAVLLFGRWSMFPAWITFIRQSVTHSNEFVSRDARRLSDPRNYEMLTSPPQVYRPKSDDVDMKDTKIDAGVNRLYSPTSKNKEFYGSEAAYHSPTQSFSRPRPSSKSISQSVRPSPSMGQTSHNIGHDHIGFTFPSSSQSPRSPPLTRRASSPDRFNSNQSLDRIGSPLTLQRTSSRNGSVLSNYRTPEPHDSIGRDWGWNPTTTYAQPSVSPQPSGRSPTQGTGREWDPRATHARGTGDQQ